MNSYDDQAARIGWEALDWAETELWKLADQAEKEPEGSAAQNKLRDYTDSLDEAKTNLTQVWERYGNGEPDGYDILLCWTDHLRVEIAGEIRYDALDDTDDKVMGIMLEAARPGGSRAGFYRPDKRTSVTSIRRETGMDRKTTLNRLYDAIGGDADKLSIRLSNGWTITGYAFDRDYDSDRIPEGWDVAGVIIERKAKHLALPTEHLDVELPHTFTPQQWDFPGGSLREDIRLEDTDEYEVEYTEGLGTTFSIRMPKGLDERQTKQWVQDHWDELIEPNIQTYRLEVYGSDLTWRKK